MLIQRATETHQGDSLSGWKSDSWALAQMTYKVQSSAYDNSSNRHRNSSNWHSNSRAGTIWTIPTTRSIKMIKTIS
jgi:hypothetical protein